MSRTPKQHAALTELQKRYGGTEEGLLNEWARVSDFYNDHREIGAPGWGMLEVDVKRAWRKRYRVTQEDVVIKCACAVKVEIPHNKATVLVGRIVHGERRCQNLDLGATQKNPLPAVRRGEVAEWLALADVKERKLTDYIPPEDYTVEPMTCACGKESITTTGTHVIDDETDHSYEHCRAASRKEHPSFEGGGVREGHGDRPRFELLVPLGVPFEDQLLTRCAVHMAKGAEKYADRNWESFSDEAALERAKASAFRHLMQWLTDDGEEDHAAAVVFNLMAAEHVKAKIHPGRDTTPGDSDD